MAVRESRGDNRAMETPKHKIRQTTCTDDGQEMALMPESFAAFYQTYVLPLYRYFYQHTGNVADAEDLTATTIGKALASFRSYAGRAPIAAWLFGIARHTPRDFQRRRRNTINELDLTGAGYRNAGERVRSIVLVRTEPIVSPIVRASFSGAARQSKSKSLDYDVCT